MADWVNENAQMAELDGQDVHPADYGEQYERGIINELGGLIGTEKPEKTCRCCGRSGLRWGRHDEKWRLFEGGRLHECPVNPLQERT